MATTAPYTKPLPQMEPEARPYWGHLKNHLMHIQKCQACSQFFFPPKEFCPHCLAAEVAWTPVSGKGTVYSTVTMHRAYTPAYEGEIPYNLSLIDLDEGVRVWTANRAHGNAHPEATSFQLPPVHVAVSVPPSPHV